MGGSACLLRDGAWLLYFSADTQMIIALIIVSVALLICCVAIWFLARCLNKSIQHKPEPDRPEIPKGYRRWVPDEQENERMSQ